MRPRAYVCVRVYLSPDARQILKCAHGLCLAIDIQGEVLADDSTESRQKKAMKAAHHASCYHLYIQHVSSLF